MRTLHDYQEKAVTNVLNDWESRNKHRWLTMLISPTGSGKTVMFLDVLRRSRIPGRNLILVHTKDLLYQHLERIDSHYPMSDFGETSIIGDGIFEPWGDTVIAISHSLANKPRKMRQLLSAIPGSPISKVIVDETHRIVCNTHQDVVRSVRRYHKAARVLGVTATHERADGRGLREVLKNVSHVIQPRFLMERNYLAWPETYTTQNTSPRNFFRIYTDYCDQNNKAYEDNKAVIFAVQKRYARAYASYFNHKGITAGWILDDTPQEEREWVKKNCTIICNCGTLTEGSDIPGVRVAMLQHVSERNPLYYYQRVGRAARPIYDRSGRPVKTECLFVAPYHFDFTAKIDGDILGDILPQDEVSPPPIVPHTPPSWYVKYVDRGGW